MSEEKELLEYACGKFENGAYGEALEAFVLSYEKGYEREWVLDNIYNCYMAGNESEFLKCYEGRNTGMGTAYEDCTLDFVPCREGEYFIFDKEERSFVGRLSVPALLGVMADPGVDAMEFSAAALAMDWDIRNAGSVLNASRERKLYIICQDIKRCMSFWKVPELRECLENVMVFLGYEEFQAYFHENTSVYLPRVFCGDEEGCRRLTEIREEEHQYRLTPKGRCTENVLLTIAVPTANRGNLLLKRVEKLLKMPYDAEIEISISKNGTELYEEEYQEAGEMLDARFQYYDHGRGLRYLKNWHYAVEMSHGKYVMFVSDEDDVILESLEHYLKILDRNPKLALVRPGSTGQYSWIDKREYGKKGYEAFKTMYLVQNYISGLTVRRKDFLEADLLSLERFSDNAFYTAYAHEWWCAVLTQKGDALREPLPLIFEGESAHDAEAKKGVTSSLLWYVTYESRLDQLKGQIEFLQWMTGKDKKRAEEGLAITIGKMALLLELSRKKNYDDENYTDAVAQYVSICMDAVEKFDLDEEQKLRLLDDLKIYSLHAFALDMELGK